MTDPPATTRYPITGPRSFIDCPVHELAVSLDLEGRINSSCPECVRDASLPLDKSGGEELSLSPCHQASRYYQLSPQVSRRPPSGSSWAGGYDAAAYRACTKSAEGQRPTADPDRRDAPRRGIIANAVRWTFKGARFG